MAPVMAEQRSKFRHHSACRAVGIPAALGYADVRNLADEDYFEVRGYNLPGRSLQIGLGAVLR